LFGKQFLFLRRSGVVTICQQTVLLAVAVHLAALANAFFRVAPVPAAVGVGQFVAIPDVGLRDDPDFRVLLVMVHPYPPRFAIVAATLVVDVPRGIPERTVRSIEQVSDKESKERI